ncbi:MAG: ABC transporter substrate-binding protein [Oscillatoriaceae cyanobacterium Prado104]|jgi:branched-chain amino acid transport system substrate-binding protein|nr:ABC transporter substrate-binding protein [Oscillatoriaceae cyanobacterium Prado104]
MNLNRDRKRQSPPPIVFIGLALLAFGAYKFVPALFKNNSSEIHASLEKTGAIDTRLSSGDRILVTSQSTAEKQAGVAAFAKGDYKGAIEQFQASLQKNRNDPETAIYLSNARASDTNPLKIAVSVPIGSNPNVAQEMLRGVAQAQDEINANGGIRGQGLQVEIANDDNSPDIAKQVAESLANDSKILAVIGHNASNASVAAAPIYQEKKLVMVTPTSFANNLSGFGSYIFRTVPAIKSMASPLAEYMAKTANKTSVAICYDSQAPDNISFKDEFVASFAAVGGKVVPAVCDFSTPAFNSQASIADAVSKGAQALLLAPHIDRIDRAIELARTNGGKLALYGSTTLYTFQTIKDGQKDVEGLILPVPWHPETNPNNPFPRNAVQRWGGNVSWRTATSFDATKAAIAGLLQSTNRDGLQQALRNPSFSAPGASEDVRFLPTGDRAGNPILVQVKSGGNTGYSFVPINRF